MSESTALALAARELAQAEARERAALDAARQAQERQEAAERARIASEKAAEDARIAAEAKAALDREVAIKAERYRAAQEAAAANRAAAERERNVAHRRKINGEALQEIMLAMSDHHSGNAEEAAKIGRAIIEAIARGRVPYVRIQY